MPLSASQTKLEYEVYRHKDCSDDMWTRIQDLFRTVQFEDKDLSEAAQKNLNAGVFNSGQLHPRVEQVSILSFSAQAYTVFPY